MLNSIALPQSFATTQDRCDREAPPVENRKPDTQEIADRELGQYLEKQVNAIAPQSPSLVPRRIQVERIGLTKNASSTPYLIYWIEQHRFSLFFKRKLLWQMLQEFLNTTEKIRSVVVTEHFDLNVLIGEKWKLVFKPHFTKFVERWNNKSQIEPKSEAETLKGYTIGARGAKACARNAKVIEMHRHREQKAEKSEMQKLATSSEETADTDNVQKLVEAMRRAIANENWDILAETLYGREEHKAAAWKQLTEKEQQQLTKLTPPHVRLLVQARREGKIAAFVEHSTGGVFSIWRTRESDQEIISSTALPCFLEDLA